MQRDRLNMAEAGLNAMASKVLDAVPISEPWPVHKILGEMRRLGITSNPNHSVVLGCLSTLRGHGLIREPERGMFVRTPQKLEVVSVNPTPSKKAAIVAPEEPDLSAQLKALSSDLQSAADILSGIAHNLDSIAQKYAEEAAKAVNDARQFEDLRALMRKFVGDSK